MENISVKGARVHNLKNIDIDIPRGKFVVITGPSGSGKSSLAFDTVYAEGQRRYIESLSSYARQFLGQMEAPDVDSITGLSPAIAIDQKSTSKNPRSTVGTITEVYDYLRVLFARVGDAHCPESGEKLQSQSAEQIVRSILKFPVKTKIQILAPVIKNQKGEHKELLGRYLSMGFSKVRLNGEMLNLDEDIYINKNKNNSLDLVVDRVLMKEGIKARLTDSIEQGLKLSEGHLYILADDREHFYSEKLYSPKSGKSYPELTPRLFSFNSPIGACKCCHGIGFSKVFDRSKYIVDSNLSIAEGAIAPLGKNGSFYYCMVSSILKAEKVQETTAIKDWPKKVKDIVFDGSDKVYTYKFKSENSSYEFKKSFPGIDSWLEKRFNESSSEKVRIDLEKYMNVELCPECNGDRLNAYARKVKINGKGIMDICNMPIDEAYQFCSQLKFKGNSKVVAEKVLKEINSRLKFLNDVGLTYLTLNRSAATLSGGESQRIRLATQIGSALSGVLYVLDEPSIGLHQRDNDKLIQTLVNLRNLGNTVLVVEHDEETMRASDYIIDIGPAAGVHGGEVMAYGTPKQLIKKNTVTANFLSGREKISIPEHRRISDTFLEVHGVTKNNLNDLDIQIPLHILTVITGVSGSGKSTLIREGVVPAIQNSIRRIESKRKFYKYVSGFEVIDQIIELDQSPIGRTPKSNPATYTKLFDEIRKLMANTNDAKVRGYKAGRFSFNVKGGRCESCEGAGNIKVEMNFLPDVFIRCADCQGRRYNEETLNILYRGKSIADILEMSIEEALSFFQHHTKIKRALKVLTDVGLGYIKLGQSSTTLSGGEAQRLKLSRELSKATRGHCFYVLDEPTTGLHFKDVQVLLHAINQLVEKGHSVVIIEHNIDVIKCADYIVDLGPDGGKLGGQIVAKGTPEDIVNSKKSITAQYIKKALE